MEVPYWGGAVSAVSGTGRKLGDCCRGGVFPGTKKQVSGNMDAGGHSFFITRRLLCAGTGVLGEQGHPDGHGGQGLQEEDNRWTNSKLHTVAGVAAW